MAKNNGGGRSINLQRRAEIGAERRARTRAAILTAGFEVLGGEHGRAARVEDICAAARIARGTFYYYFPSMEAFFEALSFELTAHFDKAVHGAFELLDGPVECTSAAIRYYLHAVARDEKWGWAFVNSTVGGALFNTAVSKEAANTIKQGMDAGGFDLPSPEVGRDMLLGASLAAMSSILGQGRPADYPETMAKHILMSLGVDPRFAAELVLRPLPPLQTEGLDLSFLPAAQRAPAGSAARRPAGTLQE
jgi:AcrR family transcriptional regulator